MFDKSKITKVEICTMKGQVLLSATKNFTFPIKIDEENPEGNDRAIIIKGRKLPVLTRNAAVNAIIFKKSGDRERYPGQVDMSTDFQLNISINEKHLTALEERRRYYKVFSETPCTLNSISRGGKLVAIEPPFPSTILDMNVGGIFLKANDKIEFLPDDIVEVSLTYEKVSTPLAAKVLRVQRDKDGKVKGYGCSFIYLNSIQEEILAGYINRLQIEQRAIERAKNWQLTNN